jgi:hypothetical protein
MVTVPPARLLVVVVLAPPVIVTLPVVPPAVGAPPTMATSPAADVLRVDPPARIVMFDEAPPLAECVPLSMRMLPGLPGAA